MSSLNLAIHPSVLGNSLIVLLIISYHLFFFLLHLDILVFVLWNSGSDIYVVIYFSFYLLSFFSIFCKIFLILFFRLSLDFF